MCWNSVYVLYQCRKSCRPKKTLNHTITMHNIEGVLQNVPLWDQILWQIQNKCLKRWRSFNELSEAVSKLERVCRGLENLRSVALKLSSHKLWTQYDTQMSSVFIWKDSFLHLHTPTDTYGSKTNYLRMTHTHLDTHAHILWVQLCFCQALGQGASTVRWREWQEH